jgi:hypothetical protein
MWALPGIDVPRRIALWDDNRLNRMWIVPAQGHPGWNYLHGVYEDSWRETGMTAWLGERQRYILTTPMYLGPDATRYYYRCLDHACSDEAAMELRLRWDCGVIDPKVAPYLWDGSLLA